MMRSLFAGVTGLRTHQTRMDVLGNNISNVNTIGYKKSVSNFSDLYSDTLSAAQAPTATNGSINAKQIGLGVGTNSITVKHNQGAPQYTGNPLDLAITGEGYFVLRTPSGNQFSRAGDFKMGTTGYLENQNGYYVQGYGVTYQMGSDGNLEEISGLDQLTTKNISGFTMTQNADVGTTPAGNYRLEVIPPAAGSGLQPTYKLYKNGNEMDLSTLPGAITITPAPDVVGPPAEYTPGTTPTVTITIPGIGNIAMDLQATAPATTVPAEDIYNQMATSITSLDLIVTNNDGFQPTAQQGDIHVDQRYYENVSITNEGQVIAQLKASGTPAGFPAGTPAMAKGDRVILGYISLATFNNNEGLEKTSTNMFRQTPGSGMATYNLVGANGAGTLTTSALEMSNVDISDEMVSVITTQRGFQANSRIITVSDTLLEELINLKR